MSIKENPFALRVHESCLAVYANFKWGYLEDVYKDALEVEFQLRKIPYKREAYIEIFYKGLRLPHFYKADFVCFGDLIVEVKTSQNLGISQKAQVLNYIKATNASGGYLVNFRNENGLQYDFMPNKFGGNVPAAKISKCEKEFDGEKIISCSSPEKLIDIKKLPMAFPRD